MPTMTVRRTLRSMALALKPRRSPPMSRLSLEEGTIFGAKYRIIRCIAAGGMGAVYEVEHTQTERRRALKVMLPELVHNPTMRERFQLEARVAAHIESDFIVDVVDAGIDDDTGFPFLVMELLRGEDLRARIRRDGPMPPHEVILYLHQTALALDKTHKAFIVHRDLKPENLFLNDREDGAPRVKILDFGIAKIVAETATHGNMTRDVMGTPLYMSPEQFDVSQKVSPATDIYALGMIAFTLLVGKAYWLDHLQAAGNLLAFMRRVNDGLPEPASVRAARCGVALPQAFDAWFARATALSPIDRFETASSAVLQLADALDLPRPTRPGAIPIHSSPNLPTPESVTATSAATTLLRTQPTSYRRRLTWSIMAIAALGIAIALTVYIKRQQSGTVTAEASSGTVNPAHSKPETSHAETAESSPEHSAPKTAPLSSNQGNSPIPSTIPGMPNGELKEAKEAGSTPAKPTNDPPKASQKLTPTGSTVRTSKKSDPPIDND